MKIQLVKIKFFLDSEPPIAHFQAPEAIDVIIEIRNLESNKNDHNTLPLPLALENLNYSKEERKVKCETHILLAILCYIGEFLFYPPIVLVLFILESCLFFTILTLDGLGIIYYSPLYYLFTFLCFFCFDNLIRQLKIVSFSLL